MHSAVRSLITVSRTPVMTVAISMLESNCHILIAIRQKKSIPASIMVMTLKYCNTAYQRHQQH
ncbi:MAG: hypothetical protein K2G06_05885 [Muribaculaceae bacterium]|nr:hypothetical protein [Muribaculaceae bacterium]